jgi:enediyne biosynthesis protein E3
MTLPIDMKQDLSLLGRLKSRLLGLSLKEASFSRRAFPGQGSSSRRHLESVIHAFIEGYNLAVGTPDGFQLAGRLDASFPPSFAGFAYEGAGLYFGLADLIVPRSESRLKAFTSSAAQRHDYIVTVGAGFAIARTPLGLRRLESYQQTLDPMNAWCVADGYGFHEGFFHWKRFVDGRREAPETLTLQNRRLFDAGVGRAMWWVYGADPSMITAAISRFDGSRRPEMWAGIGTALAYAGGGPPGATSLLAELAGEYRYDLLSGIPFAAHMRHRGGNPAEWTDEVCSDLLNLSVAETSEMIVAELTTYLDSWQGTEREKWNGCYVALRDRVKRRLENVRAKRFDSFACAEGRF